MPLSLQPLSDPLKRREHYRQLLGRVLCHEKEHLGLFCAFVFALEAYAEPGSIQANVNNSGEFALITRFVMRGREYLFKYNDKGRMKKVPRIELNGDVVLRADQEGLSAQRLIEWFDKFDPVACPVNHS
jgi:hypothetical protein